MIPEFIDRIHSVDSSGKERIIADIRLVLSTLDEVAGAWLFGSFIHNERYHDIDIGILLKVNKEPYERFKIAGKIGREIEKVIKPRCHLDVRIMNGAPISFAHEVTFTGVNIYEGAPDDVVQFETGTIIQYLDIKPMLDYLDTEYLKRRRHDSY